MEIILASESEFRATILRDAGIVFKSVPANIDEKSIRSPRPGVLVCLLAQQKAQTVAKLFDKGDDIIIIASDQVVVCDKMVFEKPLDSNGKPDKVMAKSYLVRYASKPPQTYTSVMVYNLKNGKRECNYDIATVHLKPFTNKELDLILDDPITYKACGALPTGIKHSAASKIIRRHIIEMVGEPSSFEGLPLTKTLQMLKKVQSM